MIDAIATALIAPPPAIVQEARRRGRSTGRSRSRGARRAPAWPYIAGAILILRDGTACTVWIDQTGKAWCEPHAATPQPSRRLEQ